MTKEVVTALSFIMVKTESFSNLKNFFLIPHIIL